jgi:hypothetical protein
LSDWPVLPPYLHPVWSGFQFLNTHGRSSGTVEGSIRIEAMVTWLDEHGYHLSDDRERYLAIWSALDTHWLTLNRTDSKGKRQKITLPGGETGEDNEWQDEKPSSDS